MEILISDVGPLLNRQYAHAYACSLGVRFLSQSRQMQSFIINARYSFKDYFKQTIFMTSVPQCLFTPYTKKKLSRELPFLFTHLPTNIHNILSNTKYHDKLFSNCASQ
jgi:hypothetical protein